MKPVNPVKVTHCEAGVSTHGGGRLNSCRRNVFPLHAVVFFLFEDIALSFIDKMKKRLMGLLD